MTLKTFLSNACVLALALAACTKEQPATKAPQQEAETPVQTGEICDTVATEVAAPPQPEAARKGVAALPRLVDLGRGTCIPCKQMAPILEELAREYAGRAIVEVIDLRDRPQAAGEYGIKLIPTQVFFDENGKEVWRHEGFLPRDQIVARFEGMGVKPQ
jgi:thioredoxin 1